MKFGVIEDCSTVDFTFPPIVVAAKKTLTKGGTVHFNFGGPVFADKNYLGTVFPQKTKQKDFLKAYSAQFNSIEVNATRYGTPKLTTLQKWKDTVSDDFKFSLKFPQVITHRKDINDAVAQFKLDEFLVALDSLGTKNGIAFGVMANYLKPANFKALEQFVQSLPKDMDFALELRAPEWFENALILSEWQQLFSENNIIPVLTDTPGRRDVLHFCVVNTHAFIRYVGNFGDASEAKRIQQWEQRIGEYINCGVTHFWFYVHEGENRRFTLLFFNALISRLNSTYSLNIPTLVDYSLIE